MTQRELFGGNLKTYVYRKKLLCYENHFCMKETFAVDVKNSVVVIQLFAANSQLYELNEVIAVAIL